MRSPLTEKDLDPEGPILLQDDDYVFSADELALIDERDRLATTALAEGTLIPADQVFERLRQKYRRAG